MPDQKIVLKAPVNVRRALSFLSGQLKQYGLLLKYSSIVLVVQLLLGLSQLGSQRPTTAGWFLAAWAHRERLSAMGFPFPRMSAAFEGSVAYLGGDPFWVDQVFHLALWLGFSLVVFIIVAQTSSPATAAVASTCVLTAAFVQPGNIISGYFESHVLLAIIGAMILGRTDRSYLLALVGSFFLTASVFVKQTGFAAWAVIFVVLVLREIRSTAGRSMRDRFARILTVVSPFILSISGIWLLYIWLFGVGDLTSILAEPFTTGGKAPSLEVSPKMVADGLSIFRPVALWSLGVSLLVLLVRCFPHLIRFTPLGVPILLLLTGETDQSGVMFLALWLAVMVVPLLSVVGSEKGTAAVTMSMGVLLLGTMFVWDLFANYSEGPRIFKWTAIYEPANRFLVTSLAAFAIAGSAALFLRSELRPALGVRFRSGAARLSCVAVWSILGLGLLSGGVTLEGLVLPAAIGLALGIEVLRGVFARAQASRIFSGLLASLVALLLVVSLGMVRRPYQWFGIDGAPKVAGILPSGEIVSRDGEELYDRFQRMKLQTVLGQFGDEPVLFGSRNIGLSVLDTSVNVDQPCLILWWDVCSREDAQRTFELFETGFYQYAVWTIEPESSVTSNIVYWRDGKTDGIASINRFFAELDAVDESVVFTFDESLSSSFRTVVVDLRSSRN